MGSNEKIWSYEFERHKALKPGQMLLSEPFMADENFKRTAVLLCEHSKPTGTLGLVLNRPIDLRLADLLDNFPPLDTQLFLGGPVGTDSIQFLHSYGERLEGTIPLAENLYWGGDFEQLKTLIKNNTITRDQIRFFVGYSGWDYDQLMAEMAENSWIVTPAKSAFVFRKNYNHLWHDIMKQMGGIYETMAAYPENPELN